MEYCLKEMSGYIHTEDTHNIKAAEIILPLVFKLILTKSIVDIGCGIGTWLSVANSLGIRDLKGVDGAYVAKDLLEKHLNLDFFLAADLSLPLTLNRRFDLELCLEVAEHLPESSASTLVNSLVKYSDVILFSAAIPGQEGQNHLNEQWPNYWAAKFAKHDYLFLDLIRPFIWENPKVDFWYKQNIFLVVKSDHELAKKYPPSCMSLVHPELFKRKEEFYQKRIASLERNLAIHPLKRWIKTLIKSK